MSPSPNGFTASDVATRVRAIDNEHQTQYSPRQAAYDLKKLRGKHIVSRIGHTRRYEALPSGLRAMTALIVLRNKAINSNLYSPPPSPFAQPVAPTTPNRSIPTTAPSSLPCKVSSKSSASPLEDRQSFCRASPLSGKYQRPRWMTGPTPRSGRISATTSPHPLAALPAKARRPSLGSRAVPSTTPLRPAQRRWRELRPAIAPCGGRYRRQPAVRSPTGGR